MLRKCYWNVKKSSVISCLVKMDVVQLKCLIAWNRWLIGGIQWLKEKDIDITEERERSEN